jgi:hypothetical protein
MPADDLSDVSHEPIQSAGQRRRSKAWVYYSLLAVASFVVLCSGQAVPGLLGMALFGLYARYLYGGGRVVIWFW